MKFARVLAMSPLLACIHYSAAVSAQSTVNSCISYHRGTQGSDISVFINSCSYDVNVLFWASGKNLNISGACTRRKQPMCGDTVPAHGKETEFAYTGTLHVAACHWPATPTSDDGVTFSCIEGKSSLWKEHRTYRGLAHAGGRYRPSDQAQSWRRYFGHGYKWISVRAEPEGSPCAGRDVIILPNSRHR